MTEKQRFLEIGLDSLPFQDLYITSSFKKFAYADNLALLHSSENWKKLVGDFRSKQEYTSSVSPDLEVEAQSY